MVMVIYCLMVKVLNPPPTKNAVAFCGYESNLVIRVTIRLYHANAFAEVSLTSTRW